MLAQNKIKKIRNDIDLGLSQLDHLATTKLHFIGKKEKEREKKNSLLNDQIILKTQISNWTD